MKICLYSDLHIGFHPNLKPEDVIDPTADLIIDCGDVGTLDNTIDWYSNSFFDGKKVLFVAGNHTYYGNEYKQVEKVLRTYNRNIKYLSNTYVEIDGILFFGATFWTDFLLYGKQSKDLCKRTAKQYADYRSILNNSLNITPAFTERLHITALRLMSTVCSLNKPTIMITHHTPSWKSSLPKYRSDFFTSSFCSNVDWMCMRYPNIKYWLHGHVHNRCNYKLNKTKVLCNPYGYPEQCKKFNILTFDV